MWLVGQVTLWLQGLFQFAVVWSIGSTVTGMSRKGFDEFYRRLLNGLNTDHPKPNTCKITKVCHVKKLKKLKLKPDKFFMGKPSQNCGLSPKYGVTQF